MMAAATSRALASVARRSTFVQQRAPRLLYVRQLSTSPDFIVRSDVPELSFEKGNFTEFICKDLSKWSDNIALSCTSTGQNISYGSLHDRMMRWGTFLQQRALPKGAVVAVMAPNTMEYPAVMYGTIGAGCVYTGINPSYTPEEIANHLSDSGAQLVVVYGPLEPVVKQAMALNKRNLPLLSIGPQSPGQLPRVEDILQDTALGFTDPVDVSGTETMALMYSSGTTGAPKGVAVSHNAGIANVAMMSHPHFFAAASSTPSDQKSFLLMLPIFHISGFQGIGALGIRNGLRLYNMTKFDSSSFMTDIIKNKVTHLHLVPTLLNFALSRPEFTRENFGHLECLISGAAPVPSTSAAAAVEKMGEHFSLQHLYGLSEILVTHNDPVGATRIGFTGKLLPTVQAKVVDLETGRSLPPFQDGEICMKSACIMKHYLNNEAATREIIDSDGWLHSGDVGHYDQDGYFKIVDRTKELIKVNALQVSPSELEDIILRVTGVVEVSVVGVPHPKLGEAPRAYVVTNKPLTADKIFDIVKSTAAKHKHLLGGVCFVDTLPKNATGKVMRKELVKMAKEEK